MFEYLNSFLSTECRIASLQFEVFSLCSRACLIKTRRFQRSRKGASFYGQHYRDQRAIKTADLYWNVQGSDTTNDEIQTKAGQ
jgi:hypothetical protein